MRTELIHAYSKAISTIWVVMCPLIGVGFLFSTSYYFDQSELKSVHHFHDLALLARNYTLKRTIIQGGKPQVEEDPAIAQQEAADQAAAREGADLEKQSSEMTTAEGARDEKT